MTTAAVWTGTAWSKHGQVYHGGWHTDALVWNGARWVPIHEPSVGLATLRSFTITRNGAARNVNYWGNRSLGSIAPDVQRVVLVIHGSSRDARGYATSVMMAAESTGKQAVTAVVAPHFATRTDAGANPDRLYWGSQGWKQGDLSDSAAAPWRISTFEAADLLIAAAKTAFPSATDIVVTGHSAGGQFVNRYATAATAAPSARYIVANPSSYVYWSGERFLDGGWRTLDAQEQAACPEWNTWKYGLDDLNTYMTGVGTTAMRANMAARDVSLLLGDADTLQDSSLDTVCPAMLQGQHRWERGQRYVEHVQRALGRTLPVVAVPGVGHSARDMYTSPTGVSAIFGGQ